MRQEYISEHTNQSNGNLTPDHNFDRNINCSYKDLCSTLNPINFIRAKCKLQMRKEVYKRCYQT